MKILVNFILPTKDFKKTELKALPVKMNIDPEKIFSGDIEYSVVIPDFMFNELADTENKFKTTYDPNNREISGLFSDRTLTRKFQKTQTSKLISLLQDYISNLTAHIVNKHSIETKSIKKKIFIKFSHSRFHATNGLNHAYQGEEIRQTFKYFIGYELLTKNNILSFTEKEEYVKKYISKIFYANKGSSLAKHDTNLQEKEDLFLPLLAHGQSLESFEKEFSIIDWTEEREEFCKRIQNTFIRVNEDLSSFLTNLDSKKFDQIMINGGLNYNRKGNIENVLVEYGSVRVFSNCGEMGYSSELKLNPDGSITCSLPKEPIEDKKEKQKEEETYTEEEVENILVAFVKSMEQNKERPISWFRENFKKCK